MEMWKLIRSFLDISLGHPLCQKPSRLLSGTSSVLLDSLDDVLENPGVWPLSMRIEIWKFICSFLDVSLGHPLCSKPPRLLSGTSSVLLDSLDDALENPGVWPLSMRIEIWKFIRSFLDVSLGHPLCPSFSLSLRNDILYITGGNHGKRSCELRDSFMKNPNLILLHSTRRTLNIVKPPDIIKGTISFSKTRL